MPRYVVHGLVLEVNAEIRGLSAAGDRPPDVVVTLRAPSGLAAPATPVYVSPERDAHGVPSVVIARDARAIRFSYADGTIFDVDADGQRVWGTWPEGSLTVEDAATYLLGPVLSVVLRLRGILALHAGAVAIGGRGVAFCGEAGAGKSSLVAACIAAGHAAVSDDVVAVRSGARPKISSSYEYVRLWPRAAEGLIGAHHGLARITPTWEKLAMPFASHGAPLVRGEVPLAAVWIIAAGATPAIAPLSPSEAVVALVANTAVNYLLDEDQRRTELGQLGELVSAVPVRRLVVPDDYARVGDVVALVAEAVRR